MINFNDSIFIIGKSDIALRHYNLIKQVCKKKIYFISQNKILMEKKKRNFISTKIKFSKNFKPFMAIISSPSNSHLNYLKIFLNKAKFILIEKPLSNNLKSAQNFYKNIKLKKIKSKILVGYNMRHMQILKKFKDLIKKKVLGEIFFVECTVGKSLNLWRKGKLNFACTKVKTGGGALLELSHELDYLNWIFGNLKVINKFINPKKFFKFNVEQNVFITLKSNNFPISITMDLVREYPERICKVICKNGTIFMDLIKNKIIIKNKKNISHLKFSNNDLDLSYKKQINHLLLKKNNSLKSIQEAIDVLKIIDEIKR
jgi:predicted dehydrogenase